MVLGDNPFQEIIDRLSVEKHVTSTYSPTYLWCGTSDEVVDPINSKLMDEALSHAKIDHLFETFEGVGHGEGLAKGTNAEPWIDHAIEFWEKQRQR